MSEKSLDANGRWRSTTVAFRMSPEEAERLDGLVAITGMTKQDYIISRLEEKEFILIPSSRVQQGLAKQMERIYCELRRIRRASDIQPETAEMMELLAQEFVKLGIEPSESEVDLMDRAINRIKKNK